MPRSRSRLERDHPPPRRKSCHTCVTAKRRCDQRQPTCTRCDQRKLVCRYSSGPAPARSGAGPTSPAHAMLTAVGSDFLQDDSVVGGNLMDLLAPTCNVEPIKNLWETRKSPCLHQLGLHEAQAEAFGQSSEVAEAASLGLALDDHDIFGHGNMEPDLFFDFTDNTLLGNDVAVRTPLGVPTVPKRLDLARLHAALETNFSYAMDKIKTAPSKMLLETQTPWCHPMLYRDNMPRGVQEAVSACALHASKSAVNSRVIMRCIETKVDDLLGSVSQAGPIDALARTQALLIYQSIRFFDGDVLARSSADATFCQLEASIHALYEHVSWDVASGPKGGLTTTVLGDADGLSLTAQPSQRLWRSWVYQESARRTFLVASFFVHVWKMLTGQPLAHRWGDEELRHQCWTLSAHLWQARDAFEFAAAWHDRKHHVVRRGTIRSTMIDAGPGDVEVFGKMLMTAALGVDETEAWLASKGAKL